MSADCYIHRFEFKSTVSASLEDGLWKTKALFGSDPGEDNVNVEVWGFIILTIMTYS